LGNSDTSNIISTDKQYPKLSKASSGYLEIEHFNILAIFVTIALILSSPIIVQ
jgi:hypothetical protein